MGPSISASYLLSADSNSSGNFLFINSSEDAFVTKARKSIRSFVMQKARKKRLWSTSKRGSTLTSRSTKVREEVNVQMNEDWSLWLRKDLPRPDSSNDKQVQAPTPVPELPTPHEVIPHADVVRFEEFLVATGGEIEQCQQARDDAIVPLLSSCMVIGGSFDPFDSVPVQLEPRSMAVLDHFMVNISRSLVPIDVRKESNVIAAAWVTEAFVNRALMYSLLCATTLHLSNQGKTTLDEAELYKSMAVADINANLNTDARRTSDGNIWAVHMLLCVEEATCSTIRDPAITSAATISRLIHHDGLTRMVQLRGGLAALASTPSLQALILWYVHHIDSIQRQPIDSN